MTTNLMSLSPSDSGFSQQPVPSEPTVQHFLNHVLELLEQGSVRENSTLAEMLMHKSDILITRHLDVHLTSQEQQFYNWSLQLLDETGKVRNYVQKKLQNIQSAEAPIVTSNIPRTTALVSSAPTLEQQYQQAKSYATGGVEPKDLKKAFQLYEKMALAGYAPAMVETAFCLCLGIGTKPDPNRASQLAQEALKQNLTPIEKGRALCTLGVAYQFIPEKGNLALAEKSLQEAEALGDLFGEIFLAWLYCKQKKGLKDESMVKNRLPQLTQQAEKGDPVAQTLLAFCYENGHGVPKNKAIAFFWFKEAVDQDCYNAKPHILTYGISLSPKKNPKKWTVIVSWYQKAVDQGVHPAQEKLVDAQYSLGKCYFSVKGEKDEAQAVFWFKKAANQGHAKAQLTLGYCYLNGQGVKQDSVEARSWVQKAADRGNANAQLQMGYCYEVGHVGHKEEIDKIHAIFLYQKAADQGLRLAQEKLVSTQYDLGHRYLYGDLEKQDNVQAVFWFQQAADRGYIDAQCALGFCYLHGKGVKKDDTKAIFWYRKAL